MIIVCGQKDAYSRSFIFIVEKLQYKQICSTSLTKKKYIPSAHVFLIWRLFTNFLFWPGQEAAAVNCLTASFFAENTEENKAEGQGAHFVGISPGDSFHIHVQNLNYESWFGKL